jgi:deazaflavin-dependent oxidoreductase (nitroreductase family)
LLVVASALGAAKHPAWYLNLRDNPRVTVRLGGEARRMVAQTATGEERARLWARLIADFPFFVEHQRKTTREIPIVILDEVGGRGR